MHIRTISEQPVKNSTFIHLLILLTAASCIGIYLIATTVVIAKDGVTFIEYAKQLETAPVEAIKNVYQHPGYPLLILAAHKATGFLHNNTLIFSWIYSAQGATLIFRLIAIIVLYFIGKKLVDAETSFWAMLILILLPKPGQYGSDVLSDWPHICFLGLGLLLLLSGAINKKWWLFGFAGLAGGLGYLVRPESIQLIVSGSVWLSFQLVRPERAMSRGKVLSALILLLAGFLIAAGPYMTFKGAVFPKKSFDLFTQSSQPMEIIARTEQAAPDIFCAGPFAATNITKAFAEIGKNIGETLMWFFVPALLIGAYTWFKTQKWYEPEAFFIITLISINVSLMIWLYCRFGYMSYRHTLPLLILLIFYVPLGLEIFAVWCKEKVFSKRPSLAVFNGSKRCCFLCLFLLGASICAPKLFRPIRIEKKGYRAAAEWLSTNTNRSDVVSVPDRRISFYAGRTGITDENGNIPANAAYIVRLLKPRQNDTSPSSFLGQKAAYEYKSGSKNGVNAVIYKNQ